MGNMFWFTFMVVCAAVAFHFAQNFRDIRGENPVPSNILSISLYSCALVFAILASREYLSGGG